MPDFPIITLAFLYFACIFVSNTFEYKKAYWFFEFCHLAAGFLLAVSISNFTKNNLATLLGVLSIGILWEIWEIIIDHFKRIQKILLKFGIKQGPITLDDTILDILLDTAGALIYLVFIRIYKI